MKVLELFKGSGSISKYFENKDVEVISLDIEPKYNPTICCDIMEFDYKKYEIGYFDYIFASPECKIFSQLQYCLIGKKWKDMNELEQEQKKHAKFINKTIEIIEYLKPKYYFIENPLYSKIWKHVENEKYLKKFIMVDYCSFGFDYKKPTKILTNRDDLENKRCTCNKKHICRVGINSKKEKTEGQIGEITKNVLDRYAIPQPLLQYVFT